MRHAFLVAAVALAAAAPLAAQAPDARTLIARAERLQDVADDSALALVQRALVQLPRAGDPLRLKALALRCWTSAGSAEPAALVAMAERGMAEADAAGDAHASADLRLCRGYGYDAGNHSEQAAADYESSLRAGQRLRDDRILAAALMLRGEMRYYRGELGAALEDLNQSYTLYARLGVETRVRHTLNDIANLYADRRVAQYDRALEYYRQVLASNQRAGARAEVATGYYNMASTLEVKGELEPALAYFRRALELERRLGHAGETAECQRAIGVVLSKLGRPGEALRGLDEALAYFGAQKDADAQARTRLSRGAALRRLGRHADALRDLDAAAAYFQSTGNQRFMETVQDERAQALAGVGDWKGALDARNAQIGLQRALADRLREENTSRLRVQFDAEKKEAENRALLRENELRGRALRDAARIRTLGTAVIALSLAMIAILAALVVRHFRHARQMRALAMTDELTRLPNRRHLLTVAGQRVDAAKQGTGPLSVLALDVDHFKRINDAHGHEVGDQVLRRVAELFRATLRRDDVIGRTGGEEFVVVMPGAGAAVAVEVAERLRGAVERAEWGDLAPGLSVTVSVGATEWTPGDDTFAALARRADDSLYRAKERGRNRTELATVG
ncbi:diguanylate cyclase [Longimicrobium sp.]|uniref:diguanylate cyclase n=1 Tax=Longimicrobium sp. TaxID=2029185 RepID=UPI002BF40002|nr:diguanylate cyclase [Longimicrobium sp.]HSU15022.1 diguanylate cyclase [Longimicrobium sp.]